MSIHSHNIQAILGLYRHWQHLKWIFDLARVLLLMLVNSSHRLHVLAQIGIFIGVIYSLYRMDHTKQFILMAVQPLEQQHSHILGHIQHTKYQLFYIMFVVYNAH